MDADYRWDLWLGSVYKWIRCSSAASRELAVHTAHTQGCTNEYLTLFRYDTSPVTLAARTDPEMYTEMRRLVQEDPNAIAGDFVSFSLDRPEPRTNGFYLGILDDGTLGSIVRILVYYHVAPGRTESLLTCPDVPLPIRGSDSISERSCSCLANASPTTTLVRRCDESGACNENQVCGCNPGFQLTDGSTCTGMVGQVDRAEW